MVKHGQISSAQLVMVMVVSRMFTVITYTPVYTTKPEITAAFLGELCSTLVLLAICIPMLLLFRKTQEDILTLSYRVGPRFGFLVFLFLFLGTMLSAINTLVQFQFFMVNAVFINASSVVIVLTMLIAAVYAAAMGLEGLARVGSIFFLMVLIFLVTIGMTLFDRIDLLNLKPLLNEPWKTVLFVAWGDTTRNMEVIPLLVLAPQVKGKLTHTIFYYVLWSSLMLGVISFLVTTILGEFTFRQTFPFYMISSVIDSKVIRRFDALHMIIWVLTAMLRLALFLLTGNQLLKRVLPKRLSGWGIFIEGLLTLGCALWLSSSLQYTNWIYQLIGNGWMILLLSVVLPVILLLLKKRTLAPKGGTQTAETTGGKAE